MTIETKVKYIKKFLICLKGFGYFLILLNIFFIFKYDIEMPLINFFICCITLIFALLLIKIGRKTEIRYTEDSLEVMYNVKD